MLAWDPPALPVLPLAAATAAGLYALGVRTVRRRGRRWPAARVVSFLLGCLVLAGVTGLRIEAYSWHLFSAFMFQQLTLSILVPPLLVGGAPGVLLLRATPHRGFGRLVLAAALGLLRSRAPRILLHSGFTIPLFLMSYYGVYLGGVVDAIGGTWLGHTVLQFFFLCSGLLFIIPILSIGPLPGRDSWLMRFFDIFIEMPLHVFIGVILMMATTPMVALFAEPPAAWGVDPLRDQSIAGALAWSYGEPVAMITTCLFALRWRRSERRDAERAGADRREEDEREAYNAYLRELRGH
ncbi:cytochrome c oxidase assembly protein [Tsukamurella paurometabola]|uniref:Cytochrome c oxidase assembly factor CtaG n=1 Tax=Tsukamurella paurometabola TaxID=2061 RepID=A0A3P8KQ43_TSUPA|nr:cytochrome c oxidase assembly protein [Tsukamurella paurometabola]UEA85586.1 cytochrome c oxidase assembly protein [Tsukamurella paurometabola]VDR38287.1 cytochrome c oxidase assembly factor CtaG [Tsukamurella paurometabola]